MHRQRFLRVPRRTPGICSKTAPQRGDVDRGLVWPGRADGVYQQRGLRAPRRIPGICSKTPPQRGDVDPGLVWFGLSKQSRGRLPEALKEGWPVFIKKKKNSKKYSFKFENNYNFGNQNLGKS